jgi:hypothetical protein
MNIRRLALIAVSILHYIITVITELKFYPWYIDGKGVKIPTNIKSEEWNPINWFKYAKSLPVPRTQSGFLSA